MKADTSFSDRFKYTVKSISNLHTPASDQQNVIICSTPRSGSTWLMELIWSQPGFKTCNEPLNIRIARIRKASGVTSWEELYREHGKEKVLRYFSEIKNGKHTFLNPSPFRKYYRPFSNRIVYKIINGAEYWIPDIAEVTNSKVLYLIRHPFAVALSRKQLPRLDVLCSEDVLGHFAVSVQNLAREIRSGGNFLEKAVLSWCIQNKLTLQRCPPDNCTLLTYEQLVHAPESVLSLLSETFTLPDRENLFHNLARPSAVTVQSEKGTDELIRSGERKNLTERWRTQIQEEEAEKLWSVLEAFDLMIYDRQTSFPLAHYQI